MGNNSHDALEALLLNFIKRCRVVGDRIVVEGDPTAGGHKLPHGEQDKFPDPIEHPADWKRGQ